jgi:hypothetical protein
VAPPALNDVTAAEQEGTAQLENAAQQDARDGSAATSGDLVAAVEEERAVAFDTSLTVTSIPSGAWVTVDGIGWGITPITITRLTAGRKVVRLTLDGFESQEQSVTVGASVGPASLSVSLLARD